MHKYRLHCPIPPPWTMADAGLPLAGLARPQTNIRPGKMFAKELWIRLGSRDGLVYGDGDQSGSGGALLILLA